MMSETLEKARSNSETSTLARALAMMPRLGAPSLGRGLRMARKALRFSAYWAMPFHPLRPASVADRTMTRVTWRGYVVVTA
jgi:hypothetical protein